jgi:hypothetical protein
MKTMKYFKDTTLPYLVGLPLVLIWAAALPLAALLDLWMNIREKAEEIRKNKYQFWKK